jgi:hypothetical protein
MCSHILSVSETNRPSGSAAQHAKAHLVMAITWLRRQPVKSPAMCEGHHAGRCTTHGILPAATTSDEGNMSNILSNIALVVILGLGAAFIAALLV